MTIRNIHILGTPAVLLLCVVAGSCSQGELGIGRGDALPPGEYPLLFTASIEGMTSRADDSDPWGDGDEIAVQIVDYPKAGKYKLNVDGSVKKSDDPLSWPYPEGEVKAWYPYVDINNTIEKEIVDQSSGYHEIDFLTAKTEKMHYKDPVDLTFKHQMAKVSCRLVKGEGVTEEDLKTAKVSFYGNTKAIFSEGVLTGEDNGCITPLLSNKDIDGDNKGTGYMADGCEALLVPQDMSGKNFIKIELTTKVNNNEIIKSLIYTPTNEVVLEGGIHYQYTVTVKKDRLEVQSLSASWEDKGEWQPAKPAIFRVKLTNLPEDTDLDLIFSGNVRKAEKAEEAEEEKDLFLVEGNRFSISYVVNDDNITKALNIYKDPKSIGSDRDEVTREIVKDGDNKYKYVFNYYLLNEEVTLVYTDFVQPGDYYYEDGTWGPSIFKDVKRPIGIVFKSGPGEDDIVDNYNKEDLEAIHGYAVALHDATGGRIIWGTGKSFVKTYGGEKDMPQTPYSGYNYTQLIKATGDSKRYDYSAVKAALDYRIDEAPLSSSGWYLPSIKQQRDIQYIPDRADLFIYADGEDFFKDGNYWSCVERSGTNAYAYIFDPADPAKLTVYATKADTKNPQYVRAVLTF